MNDASDSSAEKFLLGALAGASLAWLLDARNGRRRRRQLRDAAVHAAHCVTRAVDKTSRDVGNRMRGTVAAGRSLLTWNEEVTDGILVQRVRSRLGRVVSHPNAIQVESEQGCVTLRGPILTDEVEALLACVRSISGVAGVSNHLESHNEPGTVPDLQGKGRHHAGSRSESRQESWAPATRLAAGAGATAMIAFGLRARTAGIPLVSAGAALLLRAGSNRPLPQALGLDRDGRGIEVQKTVFIDAPVEQVYALWSRPENFPRIFEHVKDVQKVDGGYCWTVAGPAGLSAKWEYTITEHVPNQRIAWQSGPGAGIRHSGCVRFDAVDGRTRVQLRMVYHPVGGVLSHTLFSLLGADPKHALDEDMVRMKSLFEKGKTTAHHHTVTREQMSA